MLSVKIEEQNTCHERETTSGGGTMTSRGGQLCPVLMWAPLVITALAGVVHDRQGASGHDHDGGEDNQQGSLHWDLTVAGPPSLPVVELS